MKLPYVLFLSCALAFMACSDDSSSTSAKDEPVASSDSKKEVKSSDSKEKSSDSKEKSSDSKDNAKYDCTTESGVVVVYPAGGEKFKLGDTITVVYGADPSLAGPFFSFKYRENEDDYGTELTEEAVGEENPDGKTCYEQKIWLDPDLLNTSDEAFIQVVPYVKTKLNGKSGKFTVAE